MHSVALLVFFAWAFCLISSSCLLSKSEFWLKKLKISPNVKRSLQNYKVSKYKLIHKKFATTLALKWYPQDLIGLAKLFDVSAANQNQGGNCIFSPHISRLAPKKACILRRTVCHLASHIDNNEEYLFISAQFTFFPAIFFASKSLQNVFFLTLWQKAWVVHTGFLRIFGSKIQDFFQPFFQNNNLDDYINRDRKKCRNKAFFIVHCKCMGKTE